MAMKDANINRKLSPEEIHKLATAPFPTINVVKPIMPVGGLYRKDKEPRDDS